MRIAISGAQNTGKTTLLNNFKYVWSNYTTPSKTYRDVLTEKNLPHSSKTTTETQWEILNFMIDEQQKHDKDANVIFDRCPLDNLVYTLWANSKEVEGFDKEFVDKCITLTRESMRSLDIIFVLRHDPSIKIEDDGVRDINIEYIREIDNIFEVLRMQYEQHYEADIFFPVNDSPGIIELPTNPQARIDIISQYLDPQGDLIGDEQSIFNPENLNELEALVKQQKAAKESEEKERDLYKKFGLLK
jgi:predicted ATPase